MSMYFHNILFTGCFVDKGRLDNNNFIDYFSAKNKELIIKLRSLGVQTSSFH
jgi:hypothetical protein